MNAKIEHSTTPHTAGAFQGAAGSGIGIPWKDGGQSGKAYDLYLAHQQESVCRSQTTGKYFMLPWSDIIELAVKNGLDEK